MDQFEFEKGKPAIAVSSLDKLPSVIDTLITAVRKANLISSLRRQASKRTRERQSGRRDSHYGECIFVLLPELPYATSSGDKKTRRLPCHHSMSWQK